MLNGIIHENQHRKCEPQPQQHHQTLQEAHHAAPQELLQNSRQQDHRVNNSVKIYLDFVVYVFDCNKLKDAKFTSMYVL